MYPLGHEYVANALIIDVDAETTGVYGPYVTASFKSIRIRYWYCVPGMRLVSTYDVELPETVVIWVNDVVLAKVRSILTLVGFNTLPPFHEREIVLVLCAVTVRFVGVVYWIHD